MSEDPRCCGTGTCIINADGTCWCGQRWDGEKMCFPKLDASLTANANANANAKAPQAQPVSNATGTTDPHKA